MVNGWQTVPLGEFLTQRKEFFTIDDFSRYKRARVQSHGKGIVLRDEVEGVEIKTKKQQSARTGEFLVAEIDAKVGGFGIVPPELDGAVVSSHYFLFEINEEKCSKDWLHWFVRYNSLEEQVKAQGSTNYAAIRPSHVLNFEIPLPSLDEQRRIMKRVETLATCIAKAKSLRDESQEELEFLRASTMNAVFAGNLIFGEKKGENSNELVKSNLHERHAKWEANIRAKGKDPKKEIYEEPQSPNTNELPALPTHWQWVTWEMLLAHEDGAFRRGPFGSTLRKSIFVESGYKVYEQYCPINDDCSFGRYYITPELFKKLKSFEVKVGDFLISCSGVTLGRITQVPQGSAEGIINQALLRVRINNKIIGDKYFLYCFRAPFFQRLLFVNSTGSAIPNLKGVKELKAIPMPLPPLDEQRRIVAYLDSVQARLASLRELQSATREELDALLPSVLDRAFKGEL